MICLCVGRVVGEYYKRRHEKFNVSSFNLSFLEVAEENST